MTAVELALAERERQQTVEGWSPEHDDQHVDGSLVDVAVCYAVNKRWSDDDHGAVLIVDDNVYEDGQPVNDEKDATPRWPESWSLNWDKRKKHNRVRSLSIAIALLLAELDRVLRLPAESDSAGIENGGGQ